MFSAACDALGVSGGVEYRRYLTEVDKRRRAVDIYPPQSKQVLTAPPKEHSSGSRSVNYSKSIRETTTRFLGLCHWGLLPDYQLQRAQDI